MPATEVMPRANLDGLELGADSEAILEKSLADHILSVIRAPECRTSTRLYRFDDSFVISLVGDDGAMSNIQDTGSMEYIYNSDKLTRKVHIRTKTGTACKLEHSVSIKSLNTISDTYPEGRTPCQICIDMATKESTRPPKKKAKNREKQKQWRKDREEAREALIKHFGLNKFATNIAICLCIHNEVGHEMPGNDKGARRMIVNYWKSLNGKFRNGYLFMQDKDFYSSKKWREVRYIALQQSGGTCSLCGARSSDGVQLHVDHIKPRSKFPKYQFDLDNLQILCEDCNLGKSNYDDTDWRTLG